MASSSIRDQVDLDRVAAVADEATAGTEGVLGKIVFYAIADTIRIARDELERLFAIHQIPDAYLPEPIRPASIVGSLLKGKKVEAAIEGKRHQIAFHVEPKADGALEALLTRTRRRTEAERRSGASEWEVVTVATLVWSPEDAAKVYWAVVDSLAHEYDYAGLLTEIETEFEERRQFYGRDKISQFVGRILNDTMSVRTRPTGGVWLVPIAAMDLLERVEQLVRLLDSQYRREGDENGETEFDSILLVDREKNRIFVRSKVEERILADLREAVAGLLALATAGVRVTPADLNGPVEIRKRALRYRDEFGVVMAGDESEALAQALEDFDLAYGQATAAR
jgi:hypothetical protein